MSRMIPRLLVLKAGWMSAPLTEKENIRNWPYLWKTNSLVGSVVWNIFVKQEWSELQNYMDLKFTRFLASVITGDYLYINGSWISEVEFLWESRSLEKMGLKQDWRTSVGREESKKYGEVIGTTKIVWNTKLKGRKSLRGCSYWF